MRQTASHENSSPVAPPHAVIAQIHLASLLAVLILGQIGSTKYFNFGVTPTVPGPAIRQGFKQLALIHPRGPQRNTGGIHKVRHAGGPSEDTYAYSLAEIKSVLALLPEPARTVVLTAAFSGLRRSEIMGLCWEDYDGQTLNVRHSIWNGIESRPKTRESHPPVPVIKLLGDALNAHEQREGKLAQPDLPIFQAGNGSPLNIMNLARRIIRPLI